MRKILLALVFMSSVLPAIARDLKYLDPRGDLIILKNHNNTIEQIDKNGVHVYPKAVFWNDEPSEKKYRDRASDALESSFDD